jgi:AAA family ATP:ADP antiporter
MRKETNRRGSLHQVLSVITDIRREEVRPALLLTANFFVLFTAYYVLKPIREGLVLSMNGGAELKSSATALQAIIFIVIVPLYTVLTRRYSGRGIIVFVYLFMALNLLGLMGLGLAGFHYLGVIFYLWVGVFNVLTISQTWSLCNEMYTPEQGKRIFALIALGASAGAAFGSLVLRSLIPVIGLFWPMVVAAALLAVSSLVVWLGLAHLKGYRKPLEQPTQKPGVIENLLGGIWLVFTNRYIALIAGLILISNLINTNSEYMLGKLVADHYREQMALGLTGDASLNELIGGFYARFFFWVNIIVLVSQAVLVSRIIKRAGIGVALLFMPVLALFSYSVVLIVPILAVLRAVKIFENATDYSLHNTAREALFLPLTVEEKYKAKLAADTIFRRTGDALSRPAVFLIVETLGLGIAAFAGLNIALVLVWIVLVWRIAIHHRKRLQEDH